MFVHIVWTELFKQNLTSNIYLVHVYRSIAASNFIAAWEGSSLFLHESAAPAHKKRRIKKWFSDFGLGERDWTAQGPDLNRF